MAPFITEYPQYFTATNLEWKRLLKPDKYKDIIISSMRFLVNDKRAETFLPMAVDWSGQIMEQECMITRLGDGW
jgi:hypothetical protein